jgi:hypothetical protein
MAEIINLRRARKAKEREELSSVADANRLKFGRSKAEKALSKAESQRAKKVLDAHVLDGKTE